MFDIKDKIYRTGVQSLGRAECVKTDIKLLGLLPEWAVFRDVGRDFMYVGICLTLA